MMTIDIYLYHAVLLYQRNIEVSADKLEVPTGPEGFFVLKFSTLLSPERIDPCWFVVILPLVSYINLFFVKSKFNDDFSEFPNL